MNAQKQSVEKEQTETRPYLNRGLPHARTDVNDMDGRGGYRGQAHIIARRRRRSSSAVVEGVAVDGHAGKEGGDQGHARHVEHLKTA